MKLPMVEVAKMLLIENKWSVIPVSPNKTPLLPWKEFTERFATLEEIESWFQKWPTAQIGVVCGEISSISVIDAENGADTSFLDGYKDTTQVKTGGGGVHYIYSYCPELKNTTRSHPLVDTRNDSGYIVSVYSTSEKGSYEYIKKVDTLLPFPIHLFPQKTYTSSQMSLSPSNLTTNDISVTLLNSYDGYGQGQRNDQMARFIGRVLNKINPVHWDTVGVAIVKKANDKNTPPLTPRELEITWNSIKGIRVRSTPISGQISEELPQNIPSTDQLEQKDEVKLMSVVASEQSIKTDDIYPLEMPCFDEVIYGGVCPGDLVVISGQTSHGKTALALDWTVSFLKGKRKTPVLWFTYEVLPSNLWKKFETIGVKEDEVLVTPAKNTSGSVSWIETKIKEAKEKFGTKIIVIDHLGFLLPRTTETKNMSINYATYLTQIVRDIKTIAIQEEVIVILPVHMKKTEQIDMNAIKDAAGIGQESDLVFLIERERNRDKEAKTYFTDLTKITLAKNRKTGKTVSAWFTMINERFAYDKKNAEDAEREREFEDFGKTDKQKTFKNPYDEIDD